LDGWFIRSGREGRDMGRFLDEGIAGVHYGDKAQFDLTGMSKDDIDNVLNEKGFKIPDNNAQELYNVSRIKRGDLIAITPPGYGDTVEVFGIATSDYRYVDNDADGLWHQVDVEYLDFGTDEFGQGTRKGIMYDSSRRIERFLAGGATKINAAATNNNSSLASKEHKKYENILKEKSNLIFYGPPGTGKTFTARELAKKLVKDKDKDIFHITFHPSFSYEDFIEGYRPKKEDESGPTSVGTGGVAFPYHVKGTPVVGGGGSGQYELKNGKFKVAVNRAKELKKEGKDNVVVVMIDEINRGNIPKIFGELITLIENDKRGEMSLRLTYSDEEFSVPDNLYIIGTMNTADKSLMQMDDALKRRFAFEELMPDVELLVEHLQKKKAKGGLGLGKRKAERYSSILKKLNEKILGKGLDQKGEEARKRQYRDRQIGHSYFWNVDDDEQLQFVMRYEIIPLLQDYFYNDYDELKRVFGGKKEIIADDLTLGTFIKDEKKATDLVDSLNE